MFFRLTSSTHPSPIPWPHRWKRSAISSRECRSSDRSPDRYFWLLANNHMLHPEDCLNSVAEEDGIWAENRLRHSIGFAASSPFKSALGTAVNLEHACGIRSTKRSETPHRQTLLKTAKACSPEAGARNLSDV